MKNCQALIKKVNGWIMGKEKKMKGYCVVMCEETGRSMRG